jgi:hypothetical protein
MAKTDYSLIGDHQRSGTKVRLDSPLSRIGLPGRLLNCERRLILHFWISESTLCRNSGLFVQSARRYIQITADDLVIHRSAARAVSGLRDFYKWKGSEFLKISCLRQTGLECQFSQATMQSSMAMSLPACDRLSVRPFQPNEDL